MTVTSINKERIASCLPKDGKNEEGTINTLNIYTVQTRITLLNQQLWIIDSHITEKKDKIYFGSPAEISSIGLLLCWEECMIIWLWSGSKNLKNRGLQFTNVDFFKHKDEITIHAKLIQFVWLLW